MADKRFKSLGHSDRLHLRAAQGWLGLGNHLEADKELDEITPQLRAHPDVLEVRWHIYAHVRKLEHVYGHRRDEREDTNRDKSSRLRDFIAAG